MTYEVPIHAVQALKKALSIQPFRLRQLTLPPLHAPSNEEKLLNVAGKAHDVLFKAGTIFPFDLFPDSVTIDREKLSIVQRFFFFTARIISVPVRDILSVEADVGPFFGSIHITSRYYPVNPYSVNFLWRSDAIKLRRLLLGYIIAHERDIDCAEIDKAELVYLLNDLGQGDIG